MPEDVTGRSALVTGGSRGIGAAIARALADVGVRVALTYRTRADDANAVVRAIEARGGEAIALPCDVRDRVAVRALPGAARKRFGAIDILVNNAGMAVPREVDEITEADWDMHHATNVTPAFLLTQAVVPEMRARGWGRIVNLSSIAAQTGGSIGPHYAATKAALIGLTHAYAMRLVQSGITVNAIAPALVETEMIAHAKPSMIPMGRFGTPEETADACMMLVRNGYMTGQTINVNGGAYLA